MRWARLSVGVLDPLRRGAWYPVLSVGPDEVVLAVHQKSIIAPRSAVEIVHARPTTWTLVTREWGAPYLVCPNCAERVPLGSTAQRLRCPRCDEWFSVDGERPTGDVEDAGTEAEGGKAGGGGGGGVWYAPDIPEGQAESGSTPAPRSGGGNGVDESSVVNILLVEDSEDDAELTLRALEAAKVQNMVWMVRDGVEALQFLRGEVRHEDAPSPDLVLLDLNLPRLDGRDVLLRMREDTQLQRIPVIVLTASDAEQERLATLAADAFLTKPVDFERLGKALRSISTLGWAIVKLKP